MTIDKLKQYHDKQRKRPIDTAISIGQSIAGIATNQKNTYIVAKSGRKDKILWIKVKKNCKWKIRLIVRLLKFTVFL